MSRLGGLSVRYDDGMTSDYPVVHSRVNCFIEGLSLVKY